MTDSCIVYNIYQYSMLLVLITQLCCVELLYNIMLVDTLRRTTYVCFYFSRFDNYIERVPTRPKQGGYLIIIIHNYDDNNARWYSADNEFSARLCIVDGESKGERVKRIGSGPNWILNSDRCGAVIKQQISLFRRRTLPPAARRGLLPVFSAPQSPARPF